VYRYLLVADLDRELVNISTFYLDRYLSMKYVDEEVRETSMAVSFCVSRLAVGRCGAAGAMRLARGPFFEDPLHQNSRGYVIRSRDELLRFGCGELSISMHLGGLAVYLLPNQVLTPCLRTCDMNTSNAGYCKANHGPWTVLMQGQLEWGSSRNRRCVRGKGNSNACSLSSSLSPAVMIRSPLEGWSK
jgi:hypothetical protein